MKFNFVFLAILIFCLAIFSCSNPAGGIDTYTVRYVISGPQVIADVIGYSNETGNLDSIYNVPIPWEKTITLQGSHVVSCQAIYSNINGSTYTAKIFINGKESYSSSSSHASVHVTGRVTVVTQ